MDIAGARRRTTDMDGNLNGTAAQAHSTAPIFDADHVEVHKLFPTPIVVAPLLDAARINRELADIILDRSTRERGVKLSNDGGWQSGGDFETWSGEAGAKVMGAATILANQLTMRQDEEALVPVTPIWRINAWANVNRAGDANFPHSHAGAFWSAVYWVDDGGTSEEQALGGMFIANDPRGPMPSLYAPHLRYAISGCLSAGLSDFVTPRSGHLMMFPSWLVHAVQRYHGERPRISIAFNFAL